MSNYTAIQDAGQTLIDLLRENMGDIINPDSIMLISPGEITGNDNVRISLFLYQVLENMHLKNQEMQKIDSNKFRYPPLALDLYYMLTTYPSPQIPDRTERTKDEHMILGRAMQILYDNSILTGSILRGSLAENSEELYVTLSPMSIDDMTKIWTTFQGRPFKPSPCYLVTPVNIDSARPEISVPRVVSKETGPGEMIPKRGEE